jgi:hypothetical protein
MIDLRIVALGAMALLIAAYGASTVGNRPFNLATETAMHERLPVGDDGNRTGSIAKRDLGVFVDGFDLKK